jgi:hypothetical protein
MSKIQVHCVTSGEETKGWVHTHGMSNYGLPELEIRNVPVFLGVPASTVLRAVCKYMLDSGKQINLGENMALNEKVAFSFRKAVPIPGEEDHYKAERWELIDLACICQCEECRAAETKEGKGRQRRHGR